MIDCVVWCVYVWCVYVWCVCLCVCMRERGALNLFGEESRTALLWQSRSLADIFTEETPTANRGPNAVSVVCLKGCWSTIQFRLDCFGAHKMFLNVQIFYGSYCTMGKEHTFVNVSAYTMKVCSLSIQNCTIRSLKKIYSLRNSLQVPKQPGLN